MMMIKYFVVIESFKIGTRFNGINFFCILQLSTVWNGDPNADPLTQGNLATRFVSTFGLQQEALALQAGVNSVIKTINSFLGEEDTSNSVSYRRK